MKDLRKLWVSKTRMKSVYNQSFQENTFISQKQDKTFSLNVSQTFCFALNFYESVMNFSHAVTVILHFLQPQAFMKMKILKKESFVSYLEEQTRTFLTLGEESLGQQLIRCVHKLFLCLLMLKKNFVKVACFVSDVSPCSHFRSEINILLCGDPGTSKSQLLQVFRGVVQECLLPVLPYFCSWVLENCNVFAKIILGHLDWTGMTS